MADWIPDQFAMGGGVNNEDPPFKLKPGYLRNCSNFECLPGGGYRRIDGYERYDGRASPSDAVYKTLGFDIGTSTISVGDTVTGHTSAATAYVLAVAVASGTFGGGDAAGTLALTNISGAFQDDELLYVGGVSHATVNGTLVAQNTADANYQTYLSDAREYYRGLIGKVPSNGDANTGSVLGGFVLNDEVYAICNGTLTGVPQPAKLYKATASGWSAVDLGKYIGFEGSLSLVEIYEGDTVVGDTSGASATVARVNVGSGNWSGPTVASGRLTLTGVTGTFQNGEGLLVNGASQPDASTTSVLTDNAFSASSGQFKVITNNFFGGSNTVRAYGCDDGGVNRAWEFDGTTFTFIETGMTSDTPNNIEAHRNYLFLTFPGGSLQNSAVGQPLSWSVRQGAAEIGIGQDATDMKTNGGNSLIVTGTRGVSILLGTNNLDWDLQEVASEIGSVAKSIEETGGQTMFLDRAGINIVKPPMIMGQAYGTQSISRMIRSTINSSLTSTTLKCSGHAIIKNQYRLFFNDKTGIVGTFFGPQLQGWSFVEYPDQITCFFHGVINGVERMFAGTSSGYLMEMDKGTSFDGAAIASNIELPYNYLAKPANNKAYHRLTLEVDTPREITLTVASAFNYGADGQAGSYSTVTVPTSGEFDLPECELDGVARNISLTISHSSSFDDSFTISGAMIQFELYGIAR